MATNQCLDTARRLREIKSELEKINKNIDAYRDKIRSIEQDLRQLQEGMKNDYLRKFEYEREIASLLHRSRELEEEFKKLLQQASHLNCQLPIPTQPKPPYPEKPVHIGNLPPIVPIGVPVRRPRHRPLPVPQPRLVTS